MGGVLLLGFSPAAAASTAAPRALAAAGLLALLEEAVPKPARALDMRPPAEVEAVEEEVEDGTAAAEAAVGAAGTCCCCCSLLLLCP